MQCLFLLISFVAAANDSGSNLIKRPEAGKRPASKSVEEHPASHASSRSGNKGGGGSVSICRNCWKATRSILVQLIGAYLISSYQEVPLYWLLYSTSKSSTSCLLSSQCFGHREFCWLGTFLYKIPLQALHRSVTGGWGGGGGGKGCYT